MSEGLGRARRKGARVRKKDAAAERAGLARAQGGAVRLGRQARATASQFDRAGSAHRQAGSAFKPIVYAAAFRLGVATPGTLLEDAPLSLDSGARSGLRRATTTTSTTAG
ncbi:MAG: hypothetical protein R2862_08135 [Thermoanaerobaculia bacterium]